MIIDAASTSRIRQWRDHAWDCRAAVCVGVCAHLAVLSAAAGHPRAYPVSGACACGLVSETARGVYVCLWVCVRDCVDLRASACVHECMRVFGFVYVVSRANHDWPGVTTLVCVHRRVPYIHMYSYISVCIFASTCPIHTYVCMYICIHIRIDESHIYICICTYLYIYSRKYIYTYMCIYIFKYIFKYIYMYIYMYRYMYIYI